LAVEVVKLKCTLLDHGAQRVVWQFKGGRVTNKVKGMEARMGLGA
jgi:hypothetical protein